MNTFSAGEVSLLKKKKTPFFGANGSREAGWKGRDCKGGLFCTRWIDCSKMVELLSHGSEHGVRGAGGRETQGTNRF